MFYFRFFSVISEISKYIYLNGKSQELDVLADVTQGE